MTTGAAELSENGPGLEELRVSLQVLNEHYARDRFPSLEQRRSLLETLLGMVRDSASEFADVISQDFGHRSTYDSNLGETWATINQLKHTLASLKDWMKPQRRKTSWWFLPGRARILPQPLGVVGIMSPWNYPLMLAVQPLVAALAAGNRVMLKLSEHSPLTSALLKERLENCIPAEYLQVVLGGPATGQAFSALQFDHLLFTGSENVGRQVAIAAAQNLVPVTLELGGKSPALLHRGYSLERFAASIVQGKCFSAGQSCVAPDYLLVPLESQTAAVEALRQRVSHCFPTMLNNPDYTGVAGSSRRQRLLELCTEAEAAGASRIELNPARERFEQSPKLPLTLLLDVPPHCRVLNEELFGPVLPIVAYRELSEAIDYINARPRPLALYYFDDDRSRIEQVLTQTVSGGVTINHTLLHFINDDLPRGGVGSSGQGAYHGVSGFRTFSHEKAIFEQSIVSGAELFAPPYTPRVNQLLRLMAGRFS